jgi:uncharacterized OB-fold protein
MRNLNVRDPNKRGAPGLAPLADQFSQVYWDAARDGTLLIQRCCACGRHQFYPRGHCAACFAPDPAWVPASGRGRLHTYTVVHRTPNAEFAADCPYVLAIIELDEGPRLTARIIGEAGELADDLACDARVRVVFTPRAGDETASDKTASDSVIVLPNFALDA